MISRTVLVERDLIRTILVHPVTVAARSVATDHLDVAHEALVVVGGGRWWVVGDG